MADALVKPIEVYAYDKDDNLLGGKAAVIVKQEIIDPDAIREAADTLKETIETGFTTISTSIANEALPEAENSLVVVDTETGELFDEVTNVLTDGTILNQWTDGIETACETAVSEHNRLQTEANNNAINDAEAITGQVRIVKKEVEV